MKDLKNKVAVITGAASGIGFGLAKFSVQKEMRVVLADVEAEALAEVEAELRAAGADVAAIVTDVAKPEDVKALAQNTIDAYESVDLLINNAERNRPEAYQNDLSVAKQDPRLEELSEIFRQMVAAGMSPLTVAERVFEAIVDEKFFIFTHPELKPLIQTRLEDILEERNPVLPPMEQP